MENTAQKQALARQWRPKNWDEVIGQDHVVRALTNSLNNNRVHHAYLFTGTRGVGKTTTARILAKSLNCEQGVTSSPCQTCSHCTAIDNGSFPDLYEIDAASRTRVEDTREILSNVQYAPLSGRFKIYLIDEVHMLSNHSFNALLKTLEEPPQHVKFLLATTDPQKLPATVLSRCIQFHLTHMRSEEITQHLQHILTSDSIHFEAAGIELLADAACGSMRDALSLLDQAIVYSNQSITTENMQPMLGVLDIQTVNRILTAIQHQKTDELMTISQQLKQNGAHFNNILDQILKQLHQITVIQITGTDTAFASKDKALQDLAKAWSPEDVQLYYEIVSLGKKNLMLAPSQHLGFEMTLLRLMTFTPNAPLRQSPPLAQERKTTQAATPIKQPAEKNIISNQPTNAVSATSDLANQWLDLLSKITLKGATNALAQSCALESYSDSSIKLIIQPCHKALLSDKHIQRIKQAIEEFKQHPVELTIDVEETNKPTAQMTQEVKTESNLNRMEENLRKDPTVNDILNTFDGTLLKKTINENLENINE
jgi:DNA polymerase III subunit gamma/tau